MMYVRLAACSACLLKFGILPNSTGTLCFGLGMTLLPMSFKAKVDSMSPVLFCCLHIMFPRVICGCWNWESKPRSLTCEASTIPLCLLSPARRITSIFMVYFAICFKMILIKIKGPNIPSILLLQMNFKNLS